ncbi:conserved hypothetical protein [Candidatus Methylobacter favarea]|uniref:Lipoprotein n=1 Tax=Candidatus Methylobacter favarea TaxID=2707345 RepID=A0A8S0XRP2_9GAMM|nr:hypothetical protein [Candidatus Methylobacter favarea]CAA9890139.1 conserved hypothetical protein [Candidatus Methylobacter favarea]
MEVLSPLRFACFVLILSLVATGCANHSSKIQAKESAALPAGIAELNLREFYRFPVGAREMEPTEKLLSLNNKRVRVTGYMVKEEEPTAGLFMLAPLPVDLAEKEDGPADNLPPATLFVHMPEADANKAIIYRTGLWELIGTLRLGNFEEANGRISYARLILDQLGSTTR